MRQQTITLNGAALTPDAVIAISRGCARVELASESRTALQATRDYIEETWLNDSAPLMYAFNTGVGSLKNRRIGSEEIAVFQRNLVRSHSASTGESMPSEVVRAMMAIRANAFAGNHSGVRVAIVDRLLEMLNHGIVPVIAAKGSVGASGDLAPLAIMTAALMGMAESRVVFQGGVVPAPVAFERAGLPPTMDVQAKDATALINGATASLAYAVLAARDARALLTDATISLVMTLEALRGELACFEDRAMLARPHRGQRQIAAAVRTIVSGSGRCTEAARQVRLDAGADASMIEPRIQDAYSLRCAPQVYGPVLDALDYIDGILSVELNSATDNPLIFSDQSGGYDVVSCGHFHGQYIAQAMDLLALAVTDLGAICDRRTARLIDAACNYGLPTNLIAERPGINTGFSVIQSMGTGLVLENVGLCSPASTISLPAKGNTEDHVSNSCFAARRSRTVVENTQAIVAAEFLVAAQALDLSEPHLKEHRLGRGTAAALQALRKKVPATLGDDRWVHDDLEAVRAMVIDGTFKHAVEAVCDPLFKNIETMT
ncbi:MAG: aromatic amino acid ammonia-lyase [Burkholderia sp.]|jgi:histidine ammonia-lyase|uniref:HAL/PAL/TAL family ammonia-lyase n=1 Tax=Burkholderia sp. TaxID=36773 RepID=UPI0028367BD4|nr:aromatic amino acid lyase [Burkholderia sp.]MDR0242652.1 aromatic amino acid ammonia-lyase [Burkholderia sp.]